MHLPFALGALSSLASFGAPHSHTHPASGQINYSAAQINDGFALADIALLGLERLSTAPTNGTCTFETATPRLEWRAMPPAMRKNYTDAVQCLQKLPPQVMTAEQASTYPGVKSRYDEYLATHINLTLVIHFTADFLAWHRYFIHSYEQDLKKHCGYTGAQPYWLWPVDAAAPQNSSIFNGDAYSMGSNGVYIPDRSPVYLSNQNTTAPPGTGGGCVYSGPFTNYTVDMGPIDTANETEVASAFEYNPHCLQRDLNGFFSSQFNTWQNVTDLILQSKDIGTFQGVMQADPSYAPVGQFGVHGGGHFTPGPVMSDFYASPGDPLFFLHHGMIDHTWALWQNLDLPNRQYAINGTSTILNEPPSAEMTLNDSISFGLVAPNQTLGSLMSTMSGPFCYYYV